MKKFLLIILILVLSGVSGCGEIQINEDQGRLARLNIIFNDEEKSLSELHEAMVFWKVRTLPVSSFSSLSAQVNEESLSFRQLENKFVLTKILLTKEFGVGEGKKNSRIDVLATYPVSKDAESGVEDCHACQVLIGVAVFDGEGDAQKLVYKNLFLTLDGSWGLPPKISLSEINSPNNFKINFEHSYTSVGEIAIYQYTLLFSKGKWYEVEHRIDQRLLYDPAELFADDE